MLFGNVDGSFICETSVDRSMGEKESAEFSFGMSVNGRYGRGECGTYYSSFGFHLLRDFFLMFFMEFGINPSYVFRCFL